MGDWQDHQTCQFNHNGDRVDANGDTYDTADHNRLTSDGTCDTQNRWIRRSVDEDGDGPSDPVDTHFT